MTGALESTTGLLECARNGQRLALVPQMALQLSAGNRLRVTPLWTIHRTTRTRGTMSGQRVRTELAITMRTPAQSLSTVLVAMQGHSAAQHSCPTLALAVNRLGSAATGMLLQSLAAELRVAEFADSAALGARKGQMIGHHDAWDLSPALVGTGDRVVFADV